MNTRDGRSVNISTKWRNKKNRASRAVVMNQLYFSPRISSLVRGYEMWEDRINKYEKGLNNNNIIIIKADD